MSRSAPRAARAALAGDDTGGPGPAATAPARSVLAGVVGLALSMLLVLVGCSSDPDPMAGPAPVPAHVVDDSGAQDDLPIEVPGEPVAGGPVSITIDGETGQILPVGVDEGVLAPPRDVSLTGWYLDSALPGAGDGTGSVVLTGHINAVDQGWGFASNFTDLTAGDEVTVTTEGGGEVTYRAVADSVHDLKEDGVAEVINDFDGPERLVYVTCGGRYVGGALGYESNIVTVFEPVD